MTTAPASDALSTDAWAGVDLTVLNDLPERLDDRLLAKVEHIAQLPVAALPPTTEDNFLKCMRTLDILPARREDALSGELRLNLYRRHFISQPTAAWAFLVERATLECKWFPSPQEMKAIFDRWSRTDGPHRAVQLAQLRASQEKQARFDDLVARLKEEQVTQEEVDALPDRWKRILATQGFLRDDTLALRPWRVTPEQRGEQQEGHSPGVSPDQHGGEAGKAGRGHEDLAG